MTVGRKVERGGHVEGFIQDIDDASSISDDIFFTWFNNAGSAEDALAKGEIDFKIHVLEPLAHCFPHLDLAPLIALEVGYGGGRIIAAASNHFTNVVGVDIHKQSDRVGQMLLNRGLNNFELYSTDGVSIPLQNESVDLAYSFIVLQHIEFISVFRSYLKEISRVLAPKGIAVIYFGRPNGFSYRSKSPLLLFIDRMLEPLLLRKGWSEFDAPVNCTNLHISLSYAKKLANKYDFSVYLDLVSYRISSNGERTYGGQNGLVLQRN